MIHSKRSTATITGSTLNTALGLDTLKAQQLHYDCVKFGKKKSEPSSKVKERIVGMKLMPWQQ